MLQLETEMLRIEGNGAVHISRLVANTVNTQYRHFHVALLFIARLPLV